MKQHHLVCLTGALLAAGFVFAHGGGATPWAAPARAARKKNPVPATEASLNRGREVWVKECASCHGEKGRGDGPGVKDLEVKPSDLSAAGNVAHSDGELFWKITEGRKPMPSFAENYSEEDRWHVINYLRKITTPSPK